MDNILAFLAGFGVGMFLMCILVASARRERAAQATSDYRGADPEIIDRARRRAERDRS
jgi:hypothetical protein